MAFLCYTVMAVTGNTDSKFTYWQNRIRAVASTSMSLLGVAPASWESDCLRSQQNLLNRFAFGQTTGQGYALKMEQSR